MKGKTQAPHIHAANPTALFYNPHTVSLFSYAGVHVND